MEADVRPGDVHNLDEQRPRLDIKATKPDKWISEGPICPPRTLKMVHSEVQLLTCDTRQGHKMTRHNFEYV